MPWPGGRSIAAMLVPFAFGLIAAGPVVAQTAVKQALVIGNANYRNAAQLSTPANDADDLAAAVTGLGFEVTVLKDTTAADLREALRKFGEKKADFSVVYFGGHSIEFGGEHYLVPIDATINSEATLKRDAIPLQTVTLAVARARALGLIVFDALRPNPFPTKIERDGAREAQPETAAPDGFRNVLQFFAVEAGNTAGDGKAAVEGTGRNSALTAAILKYINEPHMEINFFFRNVRDEVRRATQNKQTPFMYGQLSRTRFYINGTAEVAAARAVARDPAAVNACDTLAGAPEDTERVKLVKGVKLDDIKTAEAIAACDDAIKQFPGISRFPYQLGRAAFAAKDYVSAIAHYNRAFELGNELALIALASMYEDGIGAKKDLARARFYYEVGVEKNLAPAMTRLGMLYERGTGVSADLTKAYNLYKRAADLGHARALYNVGLFNEKGVVVPQNATLARELYEKSATKGDDVAMLNLARLYANGVGGRKDMSKAKDWLTMAEQAGNDNAKQILANLNKPSKR